MDQLSSRHRWISAAVASALSAVAIAQSREPSERTGAAPPKATAAPSPTVTPADRSDVQARTATAASLAVARIAQLDVRLTGAAEQRDYELASEILQVAHEVEPTDTEILRLLIEAEGGAGDSDRVDELSRVLLKLDPKDSVVQLRVISNAVSALQNADERLAAYDAFLGERGVGFDPSILSRIALDAALLLRERGDMDGFASRLLKSVALDSTNKDAATLALTFFSERTDDPIGRAELLLNVIKSDPFDPEVHVALARELSSHGAFRGSSRFFGIAQALAAAQGVQEQEGVATEQQVVNWILLGAEEFIGQLNASVEAARTQIMDQREQLARGQTVPEQMPDPADARLTIDDERLRVLAAAGLGKSDLLEAAVREMAETVERTRLRVLDLKNRPEEVTDEVAAELTRSLTRESIWLRLWSGLQIDQATLGFTELKADPAVDPADIRRMEAWFKLRYGELDSAESALRELGDDTLAEIGLAVLAELRGKDADAITRYGQIALRVPGSPAGAYAMTRGGMLMEKTGARGQMPVSEFASRLEAVASSVPAWLESMINNPLEFMTLRAELVTGSDGVVGMFDKLVLRITLRNISRVPLAVGPDRPLNSRLLLIPTVRIGSEIVRKPGTQTVVSIDRRLRLLPREELKVDVWPDNSFIGLAMQEELRQSVSARLRVLQGFKLVDSLYESGPFCVSAEVGTAVRPAVSTAMANTAELTKIIEDGTALEVAEAALAFRDQLVSRDAARRPADEAAKAVVEALLKRFSTLDRAGKLLLLATMPTAALLPVMSNFDNLAARDQDSAVVRYTLLARVGDPESQLLDPANWQKSAEIASLATVIRQRLTDGVRTVARPLLPEDIATSAGQSTESDQNSPIPGATRPALPADAPAPRP